MLTPSLGLGRRRPDRVTLSARKKPDVREQNPTDLYLHDLLSEVAGKELHRKGVQMSVRCAEIEQPLSLQGTQLTLHPELVQSLESREELAFLLGQQAAFAVADQDSSGLQFGADRAAIRMMSEAGFNPSGALSALHKLYDKYPTLPSGEGLELAVKTAASGQEHEGVRLAVAQLEVEQMRRAGHPSTRAKSTPLPSLQLPEVFGESPRIQLSTSVDGMIERACSRLSGTPHSSRIDGLLQAVLEGAKGGRFRDQGLGSKAQAQVMSLLAESPVEELGGQGSELHTEFLNKLLGSDSLRGLLHPLDGPWRKLVNSLVAKRGRLGLPEGMLVANQLLGNGTEVQIPEGLAELRDRVVLERLSFPYQKPEEISGVLDQLYRSERWAPMSEDLEARMPEVLLDVARSSTLLPDFLTSPGELQPLHPKLQWQFQQLLKDPNLKAADQTAVKSFLNAHHDCDRGQKSGSSGERRAVEMAAHYSEPSILLGTKAPYENLQASLKTELQAHFGLNPEALADTGTPELKTLLRRVESGEFETLAEKGTREERREARQSEHRLNKTLRYLADAESKQVLAPLAYLSESTEHRKAFLEKLDLKDYQALLSRAEQAVERSEVLHRLAGESGFREHVGVGIGQTLMEGWMKVQPGVKNLNQWHELTARTIAFCSPALEATGSRRELGAELYSRMKSLQAEQRSEFLRKPYVGHLLTKEQWVEVLLEELSPSPETSTRELASGVAELEGEFQLRKAQPAVYKALRNEVSRRADLQPGNIDEVFPVDSRSELELAQDLQTPIAGLSALVALTREQPASIQLATIEYVMGRNKQAPEFLGDLSEAQGFLPASEIVRNVREELKSADQGMRILVADSFLAGPSGLLRREGGRESLLRHFTQGVRSKDMELVSGLAEAVLDAQGDADSLAVAALLSQAPQPSGRSSQSQILSSFFDAYGVPGIKMKQYLAFTTQFEEHQEAFAEAQDNAKPVSHYQALKLLKDRFDGAWPTHLKVEKVLGNGSVNVAVRCFNTESGQTEIVSMNRADIEEAARYDFERFQNLFETLTATPEGQEKFGFVLGLMKIVKDSVDLEFDRESGMKVQQKAFQTYNHEYKGWKVQSIDAYRAEAQGLFMAEAKGQTARKIKERDPELYREAMSVMHRVEMGILKGQGSQGKILPEALFANPDFHDGQVMISPEDKSVTILDFGQAVPISNAEREAALDLITVFAKVDSPKAAVKRLNKRFFQGVPKSERLTLEDLDPVLERKKDMGRFIRLLSTLALKGAEVPISSVHWLLALNRQVVLGKRLGSSVEKEVKAMVAGHKLGLPLGVSNTVTAAARSLVDFTSSLVPALFPPKALEAGISTGLGVSA